MQTDEVIDHQREHLIDALSNVGIKIGFNTKERILYLNNFVIHYLSNTSVVQSLNAIFLKFEYYFHSDNEAPLIFDVGGEVGISMFFFKCIYPKARIVVFEPHPLAYRVLEHNVAINHLEGVTLFNLAVTNRKESVFLYGEMSDIKGNCNTFGSSIVETWGHQHSLCTKTLVHSDKLSNYIHEDVDFLKLDIEGAEYEVVDDLQQNNKFKYIKNLYVEIHQWDRHSNLKNKLIQTLENVNFGDVSIKQDSIELHCPVFNREWIVKNNIKLSSFKGYSKKEVTVSTSDFSILNKLFYLNQNELLNEIELYKNIIDSIPAGVYWKNLDYIYIGSNKYTKDFYNKYFSIPDNSIIGKKDSELYPEHLASGFYVNDKKATQYKQEVREEIKLGEHKDMMYQISSKKPLYDKKGNVVGLIGVTLDITDRYQRLELEKINNEQKNKLAEQYRIQEMIRRLAHDIRSPLTSLLLAIENCSPYLPDSEQLLIQKITREIGNLANGILKSYSQNKEPASLINNLFILALLIEDWYSEVIYQYSNSAIEFNLTIDPSTFKCFIEGNKSMLRRSFFNLVNNAVEAIGINNSGKLDIAVRNLDEQIELRIIDTGGGIDEATKNSIQNLQQISSKKKNGNGLGLLQVYEMIKNYHATINLENNKEFNGLEIDIKFNKVSVPHWLISSIHIKPDNFLVIVSKNREIFNAWNYQLKQKGFNVNERLKHFYDLQDAIEYITSCTMPFQHNTLLFTESSFPSGDGRNKFDLIGYSHLCYQHYIISSLDSNSLKAENISSLVIAREIAEQIHFDF